MTLAVRPAFLAVLLTPACGASERQLDAVVDRGKPLIEAIQAYETVNSHPPESLAVLAPRYIPKVPGTGLESFPQFDYRVRSKSPGDWRLNVHVGGLGFKHLRFDPMGKYEVPVTPRRDGWVMIDP